MKPYNFRAAREKRDELISTYRKMKHLYPDDATWSWWITKEIEEIDQEIAAAHVSYGSCWDIKIAAMAGD